MKDYIKELRQELGMTINRFAVTVGTDFNRAKSWEDGKSIPSVTLIERITQRLDLTEEQEAGLWKSRAIAKEKRVEEPQIDFKKAFALMNSLGDNLSLVHPNHPRL